MLSTIPTILSHLKAIGKIKRLNRWVSHEFGERQQRNRFEACWLLQAFGTIVEKSRKAQYGFCLVVQCGCYEILVNLNVWPLLWTIRINYEGQGHTNPPTGQDSRSPLLKLQDLHILGCPPYPPDLAPTNYHFFRAMDSFLQGKFPACDGKCFSGFYHPPTALQMFLLAVLIIVICPINFRSQIGFFILNDLETFGSAILYK